LSCLRETGKWLLIIVSIFALLVYVPKMNQGSAKKITRDVKKGNGDRRSWPQSCS